MIIDESFFKKINLWGNIVIGALCYFMSLYLVTTRSSFLGVFLFLIIAINCTYRIRAHYKIERKRKSALSEEEVAKAARRQGFVSSIFSNATAGSYLLLLTVFFLLSHLKEKYIFSGISAVLALCFIGLLVLGIRNLKRFDRL